MPIELPKIDLKNYKGSSPGGGSSYEALPAWYNKARMSYQKYYDKELARLKTQLNYWTGKPGGAAQKTRLNTLIANLTSTYRLTYNDVGRLKTWFGQNGGDITGGGADQPGAAPGDEEDDGAETAKARADAQAELTMILQSWGLDSLVPTVIGYLQQDYSTNQILLMLRQSDAYKKRFAGNDVRIKNGYSALDPAEYLAVEDAYKRVIQSAGLPKGFYDDHDDFKNFIGNNVSAAEVQSRVDMATKATYNSDSYTLEALRRNGLGQGELVAYMLDAGRAMPILQKTFGMAQIEGSALKYGLGYDQTRVANFYNQLNQGGAIDQSYTDQAYSMVATAMPDARRLSTLYGEQVTQDVLEDEYLGRNELASAKRKRLGQREQNTFQGKGGAGEKSLGNKSRGEY